VLKVDEVADLLRVSRATVQRWCAAGKLPAFKIGQQWRVNSALLQELMTNIHGVSTPKGHDHELDAKQGPGSSSPAI